MQKRFVSWIAVSSRPQMDGGSPTDQRERNLSHIEKWGGVLVADLEVPGQSRSYIEYEEAKREIEAYRQLDALIKERAFDVLICYNVGRLGRKRSLITTVIDLCYEAGIVVYRTASPAHTLELTTRGYSDLLVEAIESATFQNEIDQLKEHHKHGMKRRIERGYFPGNVPFGWTAEYYERRKYKLIIDEQAAKAIRLAFQLYLMGESKRSIANQLNDKGFLTPGKVAKNQSARIPRLWTAEAVDLLLGRVWTYGGYAEVNRESETRDLVREKSSIIPAIIDEELLQRLVQEIASRARTNPPRGKMLFSGTVVCGNCHKKMYVVDGSKTYTRKDGTSVTAKITRARCYVCKRQISCKIIEAYLLDWFDNIDLQHLPDEQPADSESNQNEAKQLQKQLDALPAAKERAYSAFVDGDVDRDTYQAQVKRLEARKRELQSKLQAIGLKRAQHRRNEDLQQRYKTVSEVGRAMIELGKTKPKEVNQWLREYIRIEVFAEKVIRVHLV